MLTAMTIIRCLIGRWAITRSVMWLPCASALAHLTGPLGTPLFSACRLAGYTARHTNSPNVLPFHDRLQNAETLAPDRALGESQNLIHQYVVGCTLFNDKHVLRNYNKLQ